MKKNKILALLLALVMVVSLAPTVFAENYENGATVNDATTLAKFLNYKANGNQEKEDGPFQAAEDGKTVNLTANVDSFAVGTNTITVQAEDGLILDLGGHTITGAQLSSSNNSWLIAVVGKLTIQNGTIKVDKVNSTQNVTAVQAVNGGQVTLGGDGKKLNITVDGGDTARVSQAMAVSVYTDITEANETTSLTVNDGVNIYCHADKTPIGIGYFGYNAPRGNGTVSIDIKGGTVKAEGYKTSMDDNEGFFYGGSAIQGHGNNKFTSGSNKGPVNITISGNAAVEGDVFGIQILDDANVTVKDNATVKGMTGIAMKGGSLTVEKDATITGTGPSVNDEDYQLSGGEFLADGSAIQIQSNKEYNTDSEDGIQVSIEGGTVTSENGNAVTQYGDIEDETKIPDIKVSGGELKAAEGKETLHIVENETLKDGKATPSVSGGTFTSGGVGDESVNQYLSSEAAGKVVDETTGELVDFNEAVIVDFGYAEQADDAKDQAVEGRIQAGITPYKDAETWKSGLDWADQTMWVTFQNPIPKGVTVHVSVTTPSGATEIIDCVGDGIHYTYAWSYKNPEQTGDTAVEVGDYTLDPNGSTATTGEEDEKEIDFSLGLDPDCDEKATVNATDGVVATEIVDGAFNANGEAAKDAMNAAHKAITGTETGWPSELKDFGNGDGENILWVAYKPTTPQDSGATYTLNVIKEGEQVYTETNDSDVKKGGLFYISLGSQLKDVTEKPGEYVFQIINNKVCVASKAIAVYEVKYVDKDGEELTDLGTIYVGSVAEAGKLTHPALTGNYRWTQSVDGYVITYTATPYTPAVPGPAATVNTPASTNGTYTVNDRYASAGKTVTVTPKPNDGFVVDQVVVTDKNGNEVPVTDNGDGTYSFVMPGQADLPVTVKVTFKEAVGGFTDVPENAYYADAVAWAVENGVTEGTSSTTFSPDNPCTRAEIVTFLWRAAGEPEPTSAENPFTDVDVNAYYGKAVLWAVENGVTKGTSSTTFAPGETCTRSQIVTFLYRYEDSPAASGLGFSDVAEGAYYADAVAWAVENGVTKGTSSTTFSPDNPCTRGQAVTFLYRDMVK